MIARLIRWSIENRFLVLLATAIVAAWGVWAACAHAAGCHSRSVGCAGHHPHDLSGPGAADRREPDHLSADDDDAVRAGRKDRARLFVFRRLLCLCAVRRRNRSVLGALARARVSESGAVALAGRRAKARWGRTRRASAGSTSTRSSIAAARWTCRSCAHCRIGFSSTS